MNNADEYLERVNAVVEKARQYERVKVALADARDYNLGVAKLMGAEADLREAVQQLEQVIGSPNAKCD